MNTTAEYLQAQQERFDRAWANVKKRIEAAVDPRPKAAKANTAGSGQNIVRRQVQSSEVSHIRIDFLYSSNVEARSARNALAPGPGPAAPSDVDILQTKTRSHDRSEDHAVEHTAWTLADDVRNFTALHYLYCFFTSAIFLLLLGILVSGFENKDRSQKPTIWEALARVLRPAAPHWATDFYNLGVPIFSPTIYWSLAVILHPLTLVITTIFVLGFVPEITLELAKEERCLQCAKMKQALDEAATVIEQRIDDQRIKHVEIDIKHDLRGSPNLEAIKRGVQILVEETSWADSSWTV